MIDRSKYKPLPTFEQWIESGQHGNIGSDVLIKDKTKLICCKVDNANLDKPKYDQLNTFDIPSGNYKIDNHDFEYVVLTDGTNYYLTKRADFEPIKNSIKA